LNASAPSLPLSIILVNYNTRDFTLACLESLHRNLKPGGYEILVVDNASDDNSAEDIARRHPEAEVLALSENAGYARANNLAAARAAGRFLLFLNCDTEVPAGMVEHLLDFKERRSECGIVAPLLLNGDGTFQLSFGRDLSLASEFFLKFLAPLWFRTLFALKKGRIDRTVDWVSGACFLIERDLFAQVGGFDERFFIYVEDADLCRRIRQQGFKICYSTAVHVTHYLGSATSRYPSLVLPHAKRSQLTYYCKHQGPVRLSILRLYLKLRFRIKIAGHALRRDKTPLAIYKNTLKAIKEFRCEADTGR
jgi:GT2 family glycosyltransferase